jgi:carboxyl-terminal processing protease
MKQRWGGMAFVAILSFFTGGSLVRREPAANGDTYQQARLFEDVLTTIRKHYVDSVREGDLYQEATRRLVTSLRDPYAELLVGEEYRLYREQMSGLKSTPGGVSESNQRRGSAVATSSAAVEGELVRVPAVTSSGLLADGVGYVALGAVTETAAEELQAAVGQLRDQGMRSLVLDLRLNPGGLINQGVQIAELFLDPGDTIAVTRGRSSDHSRVYVDREAQRWPDLPITLLVNRGTASSAELIGAALQDHDRAAILGTPTYGKGVVQTTFRLGEDVALKLTTSRWFAPSGRSLQKPLPRSIAEWAPETDEMEPGHGPKVRYRSSAGRPLPAAQGLVPDLTVRPTQLGDPERQFLRSLGAEAGAYRAHVAAYVHEMHEAGGVDGRHLIPTAEMRTGVRRRLERQGVVIADSTFAAGTESLDREIGLAILREVKGESAELRRRIASDRQLREAAALNARAARPGDLVALAMQRAGELDQD